MFIVGKSFFSKTLSKLNMQTIPSKYINAKPRILILAGHQKLGYYLKLQNLVNPFGI